MNEPEWKKWPDECHPTHETRISDASSFDEICVLCGATDRLNAGWGWLRVPCRAKIPKSEPMQAPAIVKSVMKIRVYTDSDARRFFSK